MSLTPPLDEAGRELIDALLVTAKAEGKTVIMASHELERSAPLLADRILDVRDGTLVAPRTREVSRV